VAETITLSGHNGDQIGAYLARPTTPGPHGAVVAIHHGPGFDDWSHEVALKFAGRGYITVMPNLYHRFGAGTVEEVSARLREAGGVADVQVVGDVQGAINYVRTVAGHNGKVGVIGPCSGGRHAFLVATAIPNDIDAAVDLWGGGVVLKPEERTAMRPTSLVENTTALSAPLLGIFGNEDGNPNPEMVNTME
jgi:carboxymethylenebutenolidase